MGLFDSKNSSTASQKFIEVQDIKDNTVILKNGGLRMISVASSINFNLKGSDEQQAIINRFQGFLNSLDFTLQILINSRSLDINPYLENLKELAKTQENELLRSQIQEYTEFVRKFVEITEVMQKTFYLIVPYNPIGAKKEGALDKIKYVLKPQQAISKISPEKFKNYKSQLEQRVAHVNNGLTQIGIKTATLNTKQLTRLFYEFYNPGRT